MNYCFEKLCPADRPAVTGIFNHYIGNGFAAYYESPVGPEFFDLILSMARGYPALAARTGEGETVGFAFLRPHHPAPVFRRAGEFSCFLSPGHTRGGLGTALLGRLVREAREMGIETILASVSSLNPQSLDFHRKMGFEECGRFRGIGRKFGRDFDVVWLQKAL